MNNRDKRSQDIDDDFVEQLEHYENQRQMKDRADDDAARHDELVDVTESVATAAAALDLIYEVVAHRRVASQTETQKEQLTGREPDAVLDNPVPSGGRLSLDSIGRYRIIEQIGRGGHGIVLKALDLELNRTVALKIPRVDMALKPEMRARFGREARAAAALDHPNIVGVYDCGHDQGLDFLAVQFVDGEDLGSFLAKGNRLDPPSVARLVSQLADAVEHAHQRGVLHRDLKPTNILLEPTSDVEATTTGTRAETRIPGLDFVPRITDFGLASIQDDTQDFTQTGSVVGTPAYMSPEQASCRRELFGTPTDVYGLGTVLYQLLTGIPPFRGETVLETVRAVAERDPTAPCDIDPDVPRDLESICLKCLEKDPARRYPTARELQADVNRFLDGRPVLARPVTRWNRTVRWVKRNPIVAGLGGAAALFLVAALVATTVGWRSTRSALDRERAALEQETQARRQARAAVNQFYTEVAQDELLDVPGLTPLRHRLLQLALGYYQNLLLVTAPLPESLQDLEQAHQRAGEILRELGEPREALAHFGEAIRLQNEQLASSPDDRSVLLRRGKTYRELGGAHGQLNEWDEARTAVDTSRDVLRELIDATPQDEEILLELAQTLSTSSLIAKETGDLEGALADVQEAAAQIEPRYLTDPDDRLLARRLVNLWGSRANIESKLGQVDQAASSLDQAIEVAHHLAGEDRTSKDLDLLASSLYNRARIWLMQRQPERAIPLLQESCETADVLCLLFPEVVDYHSTLARSTQGLAVAYMQTGQRELGVQSFRENLTATERIAALSPDLLDARLTLGQSISNLAGAIGQTGGTPEEILALLQRARDTFDAILTEDPNFVPAKIGQALVLVNLAAAQNDAREHAEALEFADQAIAAIDDLNTVVPDHPQIKMNEQFAWFNRGAALEKLDRADQAVQAWQTAIELPGFKPEPEIRTCLAAALAMDDRADEALAEIERAVLEQAAERWPYQLARARALVLGAWQRSGFDDDEAIEAMAAAAVAELESARLAGQLDRPNKIRDLQDSGDFALLRGRTDFQELLARILDP